MHFGVCFHFQMGEAQPRWRDPSLALFRRAQFIGFMCGGVPGTTSSGGMPTTSMPSSPSLSPLTCPSSTRWASTASTRTAGRCITSGRTQRASPTQTSPTTFACVSLATQDERAGLKCQVLSTGTASVEMPSQKDAWLSVLNIFHGSSAKRVFAPTILCVLYLSSFLPEHTLNSRFQRRGEACWNLLLSFAQGGPGRDWLS